MDVLAENRREHFVGGCTVAAGQVGHLRVAVKVALACSIASNRLASSGPRVPSMYL